MLDFDLLNEISDYAKKHSESSKSLYIKRSNSKNAIFQNCLDGKIAEYNLYFQLLSKGYQLSAPDIKIHNEKDKSYDADFCVIARHGEIYSIPVYLHVKSMSLKSMGLYGRSVVMQRKDPIVQRPEDNHFLVIMEQVDFLNYKVFKWINSWDADYRDTITYAPSKCALYLD